MKKREIKKLTNKENDVVAKFVNDKIKLLIKECKILISIISTPNLKTKLKLLCYTFTKNFKIR